MDGHSTDATVFCCIEGSVTAAEGENVVIDWGKRDLFVVPSWHRVQHASAEDSILFSFSDRPIQEALPPFRDDGGNA